VREYNKKESILTEIRNKLGTASVRGERSNISLKMYCTTWGI